MPKVHIRQTPFSLGLGGRHQGIINLVFRHSVGPAQGVDALDQFTDRVCLSLYACWLHKQAKKYEDGK
jgi:hypothetical protein